MKVTIEFTLVKAPDGDPKRETHEVAIAVLTRLQEALTWADDSGYVYAYKSSGGDHCSEYAITGMAEVITRPRREVELGNPYPPEK